MSSSTDLRIDLAEARAALERVTRRTADLFGSVTDPGRAVRRSMWTVGDVGAHLAVALVGFTEAAGGDFGTVAPHIPATGVFAERLSAVTAATLTIEPDRDPRHLSRLIVERVDGFLHATAGLSGAERIATPWYGDGASLSLATATAMLLGEQVMHGYDVAGTLGRPWPISVDDARLMTRAITSMMPLAANPVTTARLHATYGVSVRNGGPRFVVAVDHGTVVVEPADGRRVDCHLSADPLTFALVAYGRTGQWGPIAAGRLRAWGWQPWLAFRFVNLFFNP